MKRFAISAALAGGLLAGALGLAGSANATVDANAPYYGYDAPYYGTPAPQNGTSVTFGTDGVTLNLPGGAAITAGPGGLGGWMPGK